jgi:AmiR/NasT family two-component response regulator
VSIIDIDVAVWVDTHSRDRVCEEAVGVLMQRHDLSLHDAITWLNDTADRLGVDRSRLARSIVESTHSHP